MKQTVLLLSRGGLISGEQRQLLYLIRGLDRERFDPVVLCCRGGQFQRELSDLQIRHHVYPLGGWRQLKNLWRRYRDLAYVRQLIEAEGVSLIHCSDVWLSEYALRAGRWAHLPVLLHVRFPLTSRQAQKFRCAEADMILAISKRVQMRLVDQAGLPAEKIVLVHDAVDAEVFKPFQGEGDSQILRQPYHAQGRVLIGLVGRVEPGKHALSFVRIAHSVLSRSPQAMFFIIGEAKDTDYTAQIRAYLQEHDLNEHIHMTGRREDIAEVLAGLDVLVSLSGGSVCYEAMMCGVPVISAWSRRLDETLHLRDRETGFVIPEQSEDAVASLLLELIEQDALRQRIGRQARQRALEHLQHTVLVAQTQELYQRLSGGS